MTTSGSLACVDSKKTFDEFGDRVIDASVDDTQTCGEFFPLDGEFLLSIQTVLPDPLRIIVTASTSTMGEGGGLADLSFQPIAAENCAPGMGGQPVGDPLAVEDVLIDTSGSFDVTAMGVTVDAAGNPVTCSEILADIQLLGCTRSEELFCGDVDGMVMQPIPLDLSGSTFGATKLAEPGVYGDENLPDPVLMCP